MGMAAAGVATASAITKRITCRMFVPPLFVIRRARASPLPIFITRPRMRSSKLLRPMHSYEILEALLAG